MDLVQILNILVYIEFLNLAEKYEPFKLIYSKFEQDPFNIKDFMAQNFISCLRLASICRNYNGIYRSPTI